MYLTPASIGYLNQFILALTITGYFARRGKQSTHSLLLTALFASTAAMVLLLFLDAVLPPSPRLYAVYLENTIIGLLLTLLIQFAYRFPHLYPQRRREARLALTLCLLYTLFEAGFALYRGRLLLHSAFVLYRPLYADVALIVGFAWAPLAFLRQTIAASRHDQERVEGRRVSGGRGLSHVWRPRGKAARTVRALALVFVLPLGLSLINYSRAMDYIPPAVFQPIMSAGILLTQFLVAVVYLNADPEMTSFRVRLVGITLVMVLAVFGAVGWVMTPPHVAAYRPALADHQTLRFTPNASGGYDVAEVPFHFDADRGTELEMRLVFAGASSFEDMAEVAFAFPFYGHTRHSVWVMKSGLVSLDAPLHYPNMEYHYATTPAIFPLFLALDPSPEGGVFARNDSERLTITWYRMQAHFGPSALFTFQLVLHGDGAFEITNDGLADLSYAANATPFANAWVTGASPGMPGRPPQRVRFDRAPLRGVPEGTIQDHYLELRDHVHQLLLPLAVLILVSTALVVAVLPILFQASLVRPLAALLAGTRRVEAGDYARPVPVYYPDEIGSLAQAFNKLATELGSLIQDLEGRVERRTAELQLANSHLAQEIAELDAFAHTVAHDLKSPLTIVTASTELLSGQAGMLSLEEMETVTAMAGTAAWRALAIVDSLLLLARARKTDVEAEPLAMVALVNQARQQVAQVLAEYGAELVDTGLSLAPIALGYGPWIVEVWANYLTNAAKYGGRTPRIELGGCPEPAAAPGPQVRFWVRDNGRGLSAEEQARLFTPFERLGQVKVEGQGLGLSIVKRIVEKLGGRVGVESMPGQGSLFYFTLPAVRSFDPTQGMMSD